MKDKEQILVAIKCYVYNHEPYLRDCLEGFVMQKTNFRFVAIVHDDLSKDGSAAIIREYAEKYPDIIKPIFETENQYSKHDGSLRRIMEAAIDATGAKYIAFCEGDDYWTDPLKLQKQVDFLESHPEYDMVCARFNPFMYESGELRNDDLYDNIMPENVEGMELTREHFMQFAQPVPCTVMYKQGTLRDNPIISKLKYQFDLPMYYCFLYYHRAWLMNEKMAISVRHEGSLTAMGRSATWDMYKAYVELMTYFPDDPYLPQLCASRYRADYIICDSKERDYTFKRFISDLKVYMSYKPSLHNIATLLYRVVENRINVYRKK